MTFGPGSLVAGRYHADRLVGTGGMGEVWAGEHVSAGNKVALKRLLPAAAKHPEVVTRFRREAMLLGRIQSDHVARVFDFIEDQAFGPVLVMEFIEGPSLAQILEDRSLSVEEAIDLAADLAIALNDLHEAKVVHRDLKPGNIIMQPQADGRPRAVIVDFGIGRQLSAKGSADEITGITRANIALGTVEYMAPEQILNSRDVTPLSDIYAVGAILYRSVAGVHAFGVRRGEELARAKLIEDAPKLDTGRDEEVARGLAEIVARCLKKRPAQRFGSAHELRAAVRALEDRMKEELEESTTAETRVIPMPPESNGGLAMPPPPPRSAPSVVIASRGSQPFPSHAPSPPTPAMPEPRVSRPSGGFDAAEAHRHSRPSIDPSRGMVAPGSDPRASRPSISERGSMPSISERGSMPSISERGSMPSMHDGRPSMPSMTDPGQYRGRPSMASIPELYPASQPMPQSSARSSMIHETTRSMGIGGKTVALAVFTAFAVGVALGVVVAPSAALPPANAAPSGAAPLKAEAAPTGAPEPRFSAAPCPAPRVSAAASASAALSAAAPVSRPVLSGKMPEGSWVPPAGSATPKPPPSSTSTSSSPRPTPTIDTELQ